MKWRNAARASIIAIIAALIAVISPVMPAQAASPRVDAASVPDEVVTQAAFARWPGSTITVRNTLKGLKRVAAQRAIHNWNKAKLGIRFTVVKGTSAQVVIRESHTLPCAGSGCATVGYLGRGRTAYVTLAARLDLTDPYFDASWYAMLVAHELGHILGLNHTAKRTALMNPYPSSVKYSPEGKCRFHAKQDLKRAVKLYGGKGSLALKTSCRFAKAAGAVPSVTVKVDADKLVTISWGKAKRADGYTVRRGPANGTCPAGPRKGTEVLAQGRKAVDYVILREGGRYCYRVFPYNSELYYNLKGAKSATLTATTPTPRAPTGITLTPVDTGWGDNWLGFDVRGLPSDTEIWFAATPGSRCTTSTGEFSPVYLDPDGPDITLDKRSGSTYCIAFRAVAYDFGLDLVWSPSHEIKVTT